MLTSPSALRTLQFPRTSRQPSPLLTASPWFIGPKVVPPSRTLCAGPERAASKHSGRREAGGGPAGCALRTPTPLAAVLGAEAPDSVAGTVPG